MSKIKYNTPRRTKKPKDEGARPENGENLKTGNRKPAKPGI
jgi:hypothetical protein